MPEREESGLGEICEVRREPDETLADPEPGAGRAGENPETVSGDGREPPRRGEHYSSEGDDHADEQATGRAVASEVEVRYSRAEQHRVERVGQDDEAEQGRGEDCPASGSVGGGVTVIVSVATDAGVATITGVANVAAGVEQPIAGVESTDREEEGERTGDVARREVLGEHRGTGRDDERGEAGPTVGSEQFPAKEVGREKGENRKQAGQKARERKRRDPEVEKPGEGVKGEQRVREGDPAGACSPRRGRAGRSRSQRGPPPSRETARRRVRDRDG